MVEFLKTSPAQAVIWITVLAVLVATSYYVLRRFRDSAGEDQPKASELLTNFREMHQEGCLSDLEFREIKSVLGSKLQQEINRNEEEG